MATNNPARGAKRKNKFPFHLPGDPGAGNCSLSITDAQRGHGGNYYFHLDRGLTRHTYKSNRLTVHVRDAPQNLSIGISRGNCTELKYPGNGSSLPVLEGESLLLVCASDSNPPATLSWAQGSWAQGSRTLGPSQPWEPGVLELPRVELGHGSKFTCQAQNSLGSQHVSLHLSVVYPPRPLSPSCSWEGEGLHCSCSSRAHPAPTLRWRLGEGLLEGNHSNASWTITSSSAGPWANSSLSLSGPLGSGLRLSCEARNAHGKQSAAFLLLPGKPELGGGFVLGAVGGAGVAGLLSLCPCLIFFMVKICRKQALEPAARGKDVACTLGPLSRGYQPEYPSGTPPPCLPPAMAAPTLEEDQELHYASLTFHELRPWKPQDPEGLSTTKYSEIKICK
ncbi:sialic acid-binding Ig-like lectin 11 [Leptonychotes weddellii]|uniref:Sialic acid-binding Ig-like lectin 11 n=1 Tax=Leptonychotes weddellii TaxID=9713 RepID=A0A7F8RSR4_LEPWE|nr:sialic acid-binding Ig-like lectin 11 [Leptonychotes weddellii]